MTDRRLKLVAVMALHALAVAHTVQLLLRTTGVLRDLQLVSLPTWSLAMVAAWRALRSPAAGLVRVHIDAQCGTPVDPKSVAVSKPARRCHAAGQP